MSIFVNEEGDDDDVVAEGTGTGNSLPAALAPLSPSPEQGGTGNTERDVVMRSENASPQTTEARENSTNSASESQSNQTVIFHGF